MWLCDTSGQLQPVALQGELLEISPAADGTVTSLGFAGGPFTNDGQGADLALNDRGEILLTVHLDDGRAGLVLSMPEAPPLFDDGFEGGTTSVWSSAVTTGARPGE